MADSHVTTFVPNQMQKSFIESTAVADLFSSRVGEGKSTALCWSALFHTIHNPGMDFLMIRDTWENIQRTTLQEFFHWFPPNVYGTWHESKKLWTWAESVAKGHVHWTGMEDPADVGKLQSWTLGGIGIDEPAPAVGSAGIDEYVFDMGLMRLRQPGMKNYPMKLATNNPDETHWSYKRFGPDGDNRFRLWQPSRPENERNLPDGYYENLRKTLSHRPDLVRRFIDGEFGFQSQGLAVTPQWSDKLHLADGLVPIPRLPLYICWDFGLNPTAIITQRTPMGQWLILDSVVGDGIGVTELIGDLIKPLLNDRYRDGKHEIINVGDPAGNTPEQSSSRVTAVRVLKTELGGSWRSGPVSIHERRDPLQAVLARTVNGKGVVRVDRKRAQEVHYALRGGWHYHVSRSGVQSDKPVKNIYSHPGDALGYGAAILFPQARFVEKQAIQEPQRATYFGGGEKFRIGPEGSYKMPAHGQVLSPKTPQRGYF